MPNPEPNEEPRAPNFQFTIVPKYYPQGQIQVGKDNFVNAISLQAA